MDHWRLVARCNLHRCVNPEEHKASTSKLVKLISFCLILGILPYVLQHSPAQHRVVGVDRLIDNIFFFKNHIFYSSEIVYLGLKLFRALKLLIQVAMCSF